MGMDIHIKDPYTGQAASVDKNGRISAFAISSTAQENAAILGDSYNINTGTINLTSASESALLYFKNNAENPITIVTIGNLIGNSTSGTGDVNIRVIRNPTGGTIVSGATDVDININKNFSSSKSLTADAFKGAEGLTLTGGEDAYYSLLGSAPVAYAINTGFIQLAKGASIGVLITPPAGNTSMDVQVFMAVIQN